MYIWAYTHVRWLAAGCWLLNGTHSIVLRQVASVCNQFGSESAPFSSDIHSAGEFMKQKKRPSAANVELAQNSFFPMCLEPTHRFLHLNFEYVNALHFKKNTKSLMEPFFGCA